jgi:hypothetical protein
MIGQYLSNTNEKAKVSILQNILELNKAVDDRPLLCCLNKGHGQLPTNAHPNDGELDRA